MWLTLIAIMIIIALWVNSAQHRLALIDENIKNAMNQIGVHLSSRFDELIVLLYLIKSYAEDEIESLIETVKSNRKVITAISTPDDVHSQQKIISKALSGIFIVVKRHPELNSNQKYIDTMNLVDIYDNMVCTCRLIYNHNVTKLNREIRIFPVSLLAGILGYSQKQYF